MAPTHNLFVYPHWRFLPNINKIAHGDVNIFSQIWLLRIKNLTFSHFSRKLWSKPTKYCHFCDQRVWISGNWHLTCPISKKMFLAAILDFLRKRGRLYWRKLPTDFADFQWQTPADNKVPCIKFWRKSDKKCDRESAESKKYKMAAMT